MSKNKQFETDYQLASERFPKLKNYFWSEELKVWIIDGELDICDTTGEYWDTFVIRIIVPNTYPYCVPLVIERSEKIPREADRHISKEGVCCLDIGHRLLKMSRRGIRLADFMTDKIYPYFANQIYFEQEQKYSSGEYGHGFAGVKQLYEEIGIVTIQEAVMILEYMLQAKELERNDVCFCGKRKYKKCHLEKVIFLKSVGKTQLKRDLIGFNSLQTQF